MTHPDRLVFRTDLVTVGAFRCGVEHPSFRDSGPIRQACIVFPRTAVGIEHDGAAPFVADPACVTLYNTGQRYQRHALNGDGDRCDWFAFATGVVRDVIATHEAEDAGHPDAPIRFSWAQSDAATYLRQRRLFLTLERNPHTDPLQVEETAVSLLASVIGAAYRRLHVRRDTPAVPGRDASIAVEARTLINRRFAERLTLSTIAHAIQCSPFALCRAFQRTYGMTLHRFVTEIRVRRGLERLDSGDDLTRVALDLGFSSHSHFTAVCRAIFGHPPSRLLRGCGQRSRTARF